MSTPGPDAVGGEATKMPDLAALQNLQSIEWLMKKDRILFVLKYWQQRTALAENEVHTLQEQLENFRGGDKENNHKLNNSINNNNSHTTNSNDNLTQDPPPTQDNAPNPTKEKEVSRLVEDISRLQSALSHAKDATSAQMNALEVELESKTRLMQKIESKADKDSEEFKKELAKNVRDIRGVFEGGAALGLHPRALDGLLMDRNKLDHDLKSTEFGSLSHFNPSHFPQQLRPIHPQLGTPLPPPPLISPFQTLAAQPPPAAPFHPLLNEEWRRSFGRLQENQMMSSSGQASPDTNTDRESRESPVVDVSMKSPGNLANGFLAESKNSYHIRDNRSPFKEDGHLAFKFEDRITGESLIPKGDPMEARLQEILRFNMEKYCHQNLDTLHISRRVRELLSIHNIGQRLFAKYVLGLSQGTVSELLSKPKCWDKLTEKGRDSYRKMHAWATDDNAVYLLKSLIPKKGNHKECIRGAPDENVAEDRIQHILTEASRAMTSNGPGIGVSAIPCSIGSQGLQPNVSLPPISHQQHLPPSTTNLDQDSRSTDSKSPASSTHSPSPISREGRRSRKDMEDFSQEKVTKIYQEELLKLMSRTPQAEALQMQRDTSQYPNLLFPFLSQSLLFNRSPEDMRLALDAYHQEISKIQGIPTTGIGLGAGGLGLGCGPVSVPMSMGMSGTPSMSMGMSLGAGGHNGAEDLSMPKRESRSSEEDEDATTRLPTASPFGLTRLKTETSLSLTTSPMSNLVTPISSISSSATAVSNGIDEAASTTASPLQRMASITNSLMTGSPMSGGVGLSQKPMKAVLPPITQQQFDQYSSMNTEDIVKKVKEQLSQFSISQRLFGESVLGLSQGSVSDLLARPKPWHMLTQKGREPFIRMKIFLEDDNAVHKLVASQYKIAPEKLMRTGGYGSSSSSSKSHHIKLPPDLPKTSMESSLPPVGIPSSLALSMPPHSFEPRLAYLDPLRKGFPFQANMGMRPGMGTSSVYELAALTQDLDTQAITTKIKEALLANNIGQKLFGEAILGLSQGSVSELLSKPKPWHMLSIKGREPFIRMHMWMSDPSNIEKLQTLKNQRREANKRRRALDPSIDMSQDSQDLFQVPSPGGSSKKARVLFSEEQKEAMRIAFNLDSYPNTAAIDFLSQELQLSTRTIANWFHNHRMRLRQNASSPDGGMSSPPRDIPCQPQNQFDPIQFRLLLSQRLMELRKEKGLPPTIPNLSHAFPPGFHPALFPHMPPFSIASFGLSHGDPYHSAAGLDLSIKSDHDGDDSNVSFADEDSNMSGGMSPAADRSDNEDMSIDRDRSGVQSPIGRPSSRRKPVAPQWVNPCWAGEKELPSDKDIASEKEKEVIINGVCVMQTGDYRHDREQETVHIEPTPVTDENRRLIESATEDEEEQRSSSPAMDTSFIDDRAGNCEEERIGRRDIERSYVDVQNNDQPDSQCHPILVEDKHGCEA